MSVNQNPEATSTRPYLIRAWHEWCCDNGFTPYITVAVDNSVQVPREYVKDDEIVLNIGFDATTALSMGNEYLEFKARFSGAVRDIMVPMERISAIFARENGQGMAFPMVDRSEQNRSSRKETAPRPAVSLALAQKVLDLNGDSEVGDLDSISDTSSTPQSQGSHPGGKPSLTRVK